MLLGDAPHQREAKARAVGPRGDEGLEQPLRHLLGDPRPLVEDSHPRGAADAAVDRDAHRRAGRARLDRVAHEVDQRAAHGVAVDLGAGVALGGRERHPRFGRLAAEQRADLAGDVRERDRLAAVGDRPRELEELAQHAFQAPHLVADESREAERRLGRSRALEALGGERDRVQGAADFVRETGGERAGERQALAPSARLLRVGEALGRRLPLAVPLPSQQRVGGAREAEPDQHHPDERGAAQPGDRRPLDRRAVEPDPQGGAMPRGRLDRHLDLERDAVAQRRQPARVGRGRRRRHRSAVPSRDDLLGARLLPVGEIEHALRPDQPGEQVVEAEGAREGVGRGRVQMDDDGAAAR